MEIVLSNGQVALIDTVDVSLVSQYRWCLSDGYAVTRVEKRTLSMQRLILGLQHGDTRRADHINHDTLDNRRSNLRIVTHQQNLWNSKRHPSTSPYRGIYYDKQTRSSRKWKAQIRVDGKCRNLGRFATPEEARDAYLAVAQKIRGEFYCAL